MIETILSLAPINFKVRQLVKRTALKDIKRRIIYDSLSYAERSIYLQRINKRFRLMLDKVDQDVTGVMKDPGFHYYLSTAFLFVIMLRGRINHTEDCIFAEIGEYVNCFSVSTDDQTNSKFSVDLCRYKRTVTIEDKPLNSLEIIMESIYVDESLETAVMKTVDMYTDIFPKKLNILYHTKGIWTIQ